MRRIIILLVFHWSLSFLLDAQVDSLQIIELATPEIKALRLPTTPLQQPFSIATYNAGTLQQTRQQLSLQEYLNDIPGLFSLNANNYAQDLRISIRGFGARSAFGIRGVKIVVDGIPETTPDGQGQIDNLNLGNLKRIEVLKGPAAALYGNASGGVIQIYSAENFKQNYLEAGLTFGSFQLQQYQLEGGWRKKNTKLLFQGTHTLSDGYRDQSGLKNTNANLRLFHEFSEKSKINLQVNYTNSPIGDDPGGLTLEEVIDDRRQARDRNITFKSGEAIDQFKVGTRFSHQLKSNESFQLYGFYNTRNFEGRLPFEFGGWVDLQRHYFGQGGHYQWKKEWPKAYNNFQIGYALAGQYDQRQRFVNDSGSKGMLTLDQLEQFSNIGIFALNHFYINKWLLTFGLRQDWNSLQVEDQFISNGDQSGMRSIPTFNPSFGINYELKKRLHLYGNIRSSFETPTLSELSANPSGAAGFNPELNSQQALNFELGIKGLLFKRLDFDLTFFHINTQNDLVPFELEAFPERTFFRNAGSTTRQGIETWIRYAFTPQLTLKTSYTYSNFTYKDYILPQGDFSDNQLPGIPPHFATTTLAYQSDGGLNARLQHRLIDDFFTNDINDISETAYQILDFSIGYRFKVRGSICTPFFGINNIFDTEYSDNIRLNAFGARYYEPAPGINIYGGLRWRFSEGQ